MAGSNIKKIGLLAGPLLCAAALLLPGGMLSPDADKVLAVAIWMVVWWITEAVSISVTALLPLAFFPLLGVADMKSVSAAYGNPIIFLFFGGFIIALAMEKVQLHRRIALKVIQLTGTSPDMVVLGFMIATALLSMLISNTATTLVMLPIALSVVEMLQHDEDGFTSNDKNFALSIMLGIAYAANIGGVATIIGTPPNMVLIGFLEATYDIEISFLQWMTIGLPFSIVMLAILYVVLVKWLYPNRLQGRASGKTVIEKELSRLGVLNREEKQVLAIFMLAMLLWIFRTQLNIWLPMIPLSDTGISMLAGVLLFTLPLNWKKGSFILDWEDTKKLPWGILILFGGGLALAYSMSESGIIDAIGSAISSYSGLTEIFLLLILVFVMLFMTELMSNVALVTIFIPVVAGIAGGFQIPLIELLIPVTIASSCAFMLPMATPPNAIVFASGHVKVNQMVKTGIYLNLLSVLVIVILCKWLLPVIF